MSIVLLKVTEEKAQATSIFFQILPKRFFCWLPLAIQGRSKRKQLNGSGENERLKKNRKQANRLSKSYTRISN